jgi:hypothetical protein
MDKKYVRERLNHLIGKRYNRGVLRLLLNNIFKDNVSIYEVEEQYLYENEDYRFECYCGDIDFTIWFAKTRNESQFIITEISID